MIFPIRIPFPTYILYANFASPLHFINSSRSLINSYNCRSSVFVCIFTFRRSVVKSPRMSMNNSGDLSSEVCLVEVPVFTHWITACGQRALTPKHVLPFVWGFDCGLAWFLVGKKSHVICLHESAYVLEPLYQSLSSSHTHTLYLGCKIDWSVINILIPTTFST